MSDKKFLTVMAVFDDQTQKTLARIQSCIIEQVGEGTQTRGIPFHLTLGSYPTNMQTETVERIKRVASKCKPFDIMLSEYNTFGDKVLFLEPNLPWELLNLRKSFECDYANGFEWVPHATLFCGEITEVQKVRSLLPELVEPICARIVGIELGEFFPPKKIIRINFEE